MPDHATFTKRTPTTPDSYPAEAAGLAWLAAAGPGAARVVRVREVSAERLVLDRLTPAVPDRKSAAAFGTALAVTHAAGAAAFGSGPDRWTADGYIGTQPLSLRPAAHWGTFYADQRLLPYAERARQRGNLTSEALADVQRVCDRLREGDFDDDTTPARIHGDLWSGNVIFTAGRVVLIDPAAHGGHRLTDLAMLHLFGAPYLDVIIGAYAEAAALSAGWSDMIGLHQLHPLLVHAVTHGPAYGSDSARVAARYR